MEEKSELDCVQQLIKNSIFITVSSEEAKSPKWTQEKNMHFLTQLRFVSPKPQTLCHTKNTEFFQ